MINRTDNTPVIVGVSQQTWREPDTTRTPIDALHEVATAALTDSNSDKLLASIDALAMVRFIADTNPDMAALFPRNPGELLAQRLGIDNARIFQATIGGNTPQQLVNHFAHKLATGEHQAVLISGVELLATLFSALGSGGDVSAWPGEKTSLPTTIGEEKDGLTAAEKLHGLYEPINTYPLFETSLRHHLGVSAEEHSTLIAALCGNMSTIAANNPYAWFQQARSAADIGTVTDNNRYIGYPYTKAMNARLAVDMGAALIMTTAGKARELGIDDRQLVYLRGGVDVNDIWYLSERPALHESPAICLAASTILPHAGVCVDEINHFDIYSCFPSAVQVACNEIGISPLDPRGVTVTGGLPYFGGPGNNYSLHAIAEMVAKLRGEESNHGLVTANGLYLTKHSLGLYSTEPSEQPWQTIDNSKLQQEIDDAPRRQLAADPTGNATIESFAVAFDRNGPVKGIIIAENDKRERIVANTLKSEDVLYQLIEQDPIGSGGKVRRDGEHNIFEF
ncbi:MAG: acetyl-CoA acetyltransferase [Pseudomonadales bacterium]